MRGRRTLAAGTFVAAALATLGGCSTAQFELPSPGQQETGHWEWTAEKDPVLPVTPTDDSTSMRPIVVRTPDSWLMFYSIFDADVWKLAQSPSPDGKNWAIPRYVLSPYGDNWETSQLIGGSVLRRDGRLWLWYQGGKRRQVGTASSGEGRFWRKDAEPVLLPGQEKEWDAGGVGSPTVIQSGSQFYMYYVGRGTFGGTAIGAAVSSDGVRWKKLRTNPVLQPDPASPVDARGVDSPAVWSAHGQWWMLYTAAGADRRHTIALASSRDGIAWNKKGTLIQGSADWNVPDVRDPCVVTEGGITQIWFAGGDQLTDGNPVHGQIGKGTLTWKP